MDNSLSFGKTAQDQAVKFELVASPVVAARFLGSSVFIASIDTTYTVKIWNYKEHQCLQSLQSSHPRQQEQITGILVFSEGKFAVLSKHITFFDTLTNKVEDMPRPLLTAQQVQIRK